MLRDQGYQVYHGKEWKKGSKVSKHSRVDVLSKVRKLTSGLQLEAQKTQ